MLPGWSRSWKSEAVGGPLGDSALIGELEVTWHFLSWSEGTLVPSGAEPTGVFHTPSPTLDARVHWSQSPK